MGKNGMELEALGIEHIVEFGNRNAEVGKRAFDYGFRKRNKIQNYSPKF